MRGDVFSRFYFYGMLFHEDEMLYIGVVFVYLALKSLFYAKFRVSYC